MKSPTLQKIHDYQIECMEELLIKCNAKQRKEFQTKFGDLQWLCEREIRQAILFLEKAINERK